MRALSIRERKLVATGLLVAAMALAWLLLVAPVIDGFAQRAEQREQLRAAYVRNSRMINAIPQMRRRAENLGTVKSRFFVNAGNGAVARDRLRERLRRELAAAGGEVTAVQDVPASAGTVRAWVQGRITYDRLVNLLVSLSDSTPYLVIESLRISADRALESGHLDMLDIRLEASVPYLTAAS